MVQTTLLNHKETLVCLLPFLWYGCTVQVECNGAVRRWQPEMRSVGTSCCSLGWPSSGTQN